jgi:RND family efflux transporter MFP subunit
MSYVGSLVSRFVQIRCCWLGPCACRWKPLQPQIALFAVLIVISQAGCSRSDPPSSSRVAVTVLTAGGDLTPQSAAYTATLQPAQKVTVAFQVSGYVNSIHQMSGADGRTRDIQAGDPVQAQEVLATVRSDTFLAQVKQESTAVATAEVLYNKTKRDLERNAELRRQEVIAQTTYEQAADDFETAKSQLAQSQAALKEAQVNLDYCSLKSPIDGTLLDRQIEVGSLVEQSATGFTVANTREMRAVFGVSDLELARLKQGSLQAVTTEALPGVTLVGRITDIAANADPVTRTFNVEVTVPNKDGRLRSGMLASLQIANRPPFSIASVIALPLNAIVRPPGDSKDFAIYIVQDRSGRSFAQLRKVSLGDIVGNQIAVTEGVATGDRVIIRGATMVNEGSEVRVIP